MSNETTKYYTITNVINAALTQCFHVGKKTEDISLQMITDMTYSNIWNEFAKWCTEQSEYGYLLNIYPFASMFYISNKQYEGISLKFTDIFLREYGLRLDDNKFNYEKTNDNKFNPSAAQSQKLNYIALSSELNLPKIYVQNGLNNLFKAVATLLGSTDSCVVDLGLFGCITCQSKIVYHTPSKLKKDSLFNKKTTVKTLMEKYNAHESSPLEKETSNTVGTKKTNKVIEETKNTSSAKKSMLTLRVNPINQVLGVPKVNKINLDYLPSPVKKQESNQQAKKDKCMLIPLRDLNWDVKAMMDTTFRRSDRNRITTEPVLFNLYSNTKAAPFTNEKTQIPISHRIGSFYTLSLQNFIIDKTSKSIKRLYDDYFYKWKTILFATSATEDEEYLSLLSSDVDTKTVTLRKNSYSIYLHYISNIIPDDCISDIKEKWLLNIIRMCLRSYNLTNADRYNDMLNFCIREIVLNYNFSMKKSILDYILKHPEQRNKLNIPTTFRKLKEYAEERIKRVSDDKNDWKRNWSLCKLRVSNNLMIICENITKVLKYYTKNLEKTSFLDLSFYDWNTSRLTNFVKNQKAKIDDQKTAVTDDWKNFIEGILKENKVYKDQLIIYFKSISGVMSSQLRKLILSSLQKYHEFIFQFKQEKYFQPEEVFSQQYSPKFPFQKSFLELEIKEHQSGTKFIFSDDLGDIHSKLTNLINEIVKCSKEVERADNIFIKNLEKRNNLWEVPIKDKVVSLILTEVDFTIKENLDEINKVLKLYDPFVFVMTEQNALDKFKNSNPKREEIRTKIKFYEDKLKVLREQMPNNIHMNMIKINCTEVNQILREKLNEFIIDLLKQVHNKNIITKSKELLERIEDLTQELEVQANDEETLATLENNCEMYKTQLVPQLYTEYADFLEWIFFYLSYETYPVMEASKDSGNSFEMQIKQCFHQFKYIDSNLQAFSDNITDKKNQLQGNLDKTRAAVFGKISALKADVDYQKENAVSLLIGDDTGAAFLSKLKQLEDRCKETNLELQDMIRRESLLGSIYPTEDERIDQCLKDLEPMINYFNFFLDYKLIQPDLDEIRDLDFNALMALIERSTDLFGVSMQKIPTLKTRIQKAREEFRKFRTGVELGKYLFSLVDIFKFENLSEENSNLFEDNGYFCHEVAKLLYKDYDKGPSKAQEILKNLKLKEVIANAQILERYTKYKNEIEKLVEEWENVNKMYDILAGIATEVDLEFKLENFQDKVYVVVNHDSYTLIKSVLKKNIQVAEDNISLVEMSKDKIKILRTVRDFKGKLSILYELVENLETNQLLLEKHMEKMSQMNQKKNNEGYKNLKQAEKEFKLLIEFIMSNPKVKSILSARDYFREVLGNSSKMLTEVKFDSQID